MHPEIQHCTKNEEILIGKLHFFVQCKVILAWKYQSQGFTLVYCFLVSQLCENKLRDIRELPAGKNSRNFLNFLLWTREIIIFKVSINRNSLPKVFLGKDVLKKYSEFAGEHPCQSVISIKLLCTSVLVFSFKFAAHFLNTFL